MLFLMCSTDEDVEAGGFEQRDLVSDGECGEAWKLLGKLHCFDDAFGRQITEFVPEADIQSHSMLCAVILDGKNKK